jgi:hypothetical protein
MWRAVSWSQCVECGRETLDPFIVRHRETDLVRQSERGAVANDDSLPQELVTEPRWSVAEEEIGIGRA